MMPNDTAAPSIIPIQSLNGISVVDSNLFHIVSLASLSDNKLTNVQQVNLENILNFPGLANAFQYYFKYNGLEGIPSSLFGPVMIQLQPADKVASLLYLERSMGSGILYTIVSKEFKIENGLPYFSDKNIECIHFASKDHIRVHFNRVHPIVCMVSSLISLANAIFVINHSNNQGVLNFIDGLTRKVLKERESNSDNPNGLLLAEHRKTADGKDFFLEPEEEPEELISGGWKEDFIDLLMNIRAYIPSLLEYVSKKEREYSNNYLNDSIGPIRLKYLNDNNAEGLFLHIRSNSSQGYEFWVGKVPFEGDKNCPRIDYEHILVRKKRLTSSDILNWFPAIDSLDLLLPLFLQAYSFIHEYRIPQKPIQEIIAECQRNHPRETRLALRDLARIKNCDVEDIPVYFSEEEIQHTLYNAIRLCKESSRVIKELRPFHHLGSTEDILFPGSREEFEHIQKERLRAVRDAEYKRRVCIINQKAPTQRKG